MVFKCPFKLIYRKWESSQKDKNREEVNYERANGEEVKEDITPDER